LKRFVLLLWLLVGAAGALAACGSGDEEESRTLTVYSGRAERLVGELLEEFKRESGVDVRVRYADSAELAATIGEEGDRSPADVFFSQDAGALGAVEDRLQPLPEELLDKVDARYRDPQGRWVGTSGRARVVAYSTERLKESDLPDSIFDFTDPKWKGRIGFPPPNASFQAFVSAMRLDVGDERTRRWLEDIKKNDPVLLENNIQTEEAIANGEIDVGFVNHYYLHELRQEHGDDFPVANHFLRKGDPGALVNVAGVGILRTSKRSEEARELVEFLLSERGQRYSAEQTGEYPLVKGVPAPEGLPPLSSLQGPDISLGALGAKLESTLKMLDEVGLGT